jgi:competence protein ComEA
VDGSGSNRQHGGPTSRSGDVRAGAFTSIAVEDSMRRISCVIAILACALAVPLAAQDKPAPAARPRQAAAAPAAPVNLNTATQAQIETLPGIGAKAAERIIEYRQKNGGFKKIEELMNVKGIGEKSFLKLKPYLTVGEKPDKAGAKQ